jgi:DNA-binding IclR family transcriptional regulator
MAEKRLSYQQWMVREAIKQFPGADVHELSESTLIPREVFWRRLSELERLGFVARGADDRYYMIPVRPEDFPELPSER